MKIFESSFFLYCIKEWNNRSEELQKIKSIVQFKTKILSFIRPKENSIFKIHDINGIKLLNCLRLHFSHLNEHKFQHNFRATINHMCSCGLEPETTLHYLLHCNLYSDLRTELLDDICALNPTLKNLSHEKLLNILPYRSENFSFNTNKKIIKSTKFSKTAERFIGLLFWPFIYTIRILSERISLNIIYKFLFKDYMYICMQHLNASILWLVSVLGPASCRFYSFKLYLCRCLFVKFKSVLWRKKSEVCSIFSSIRHNEQGIKWLILMVILSGTYLPIRVAKPRL